jgi:hypothetical protein
MSHFSSRSAFATVAVLALSTVGVAVIGGGAARADTTTTTRSFTAPGTYTVTIPPNTNAMTLDALGGAGFPGDDSATQFSTGGSAGSGTHVQQTVTVYNQPVAVLPGDTLQVVVGAKGGGGQRGYGDELSGSGGNGGGASYVLDLTANTLLLVAGGGGGGGGGGGTFVGYDGGRGGTNGNGGPGIGTIGGNAGGAGAKGQQGVCGSSGLSSGTPGESAPTASAVAGGGGGGGGACGGTGGGSGDHGAGAGGGGGGGAGASLGNPGATFGQGTNTGDGTASLTFTSYVPHAPVITSPTCMYANNFQIPGEIGQPLTATGYPAPSFQLLNQPSWLRVAPQPPSRDGASARLSLDAAAGAADGGIDDASQYQFQVQATNSQGSTIEALTLDTASSRPTFLTAPAATATAGSPFTFAVLAVGCPPIVSYSLTGIDTATNNWLKINPATGELSGTPTAADIGTHTFTVHADTGVAGTTPLTQSFTVQVNPAPLAVTPRALPAGTLGSPYTATLEAAGGTPPNSWTLATGSSLPAGLTLHPDGTIGGTPTATGLGSFTAWVTDSANPAQVASRYLSMQVNPAPLTVTPPSPTITYGGAVPTLTPTYSGLVNGDTAPTTPPSCTALDANGHPVTGTPSAGTYAVHCAGAADGNYTVGYASDGILTVGRAPLTITASSTAITYGSTAAAITAKMDGLVNGDTSDVLGSGLTCSTSAGPTSTVAGSPYPSNCTGAVDANYVIAYVSGQVTVNPAVLTVTANDKSRLFGATDPPLTATLSGFVNGENASTAGISGTPACRDSVSPSAPVGSYPGAITCTAGTLTTRNYTLAAGPAGTLTLTATITISGPAIGALSIGSGQTVLVGPHATVNGPVTIAPGGSLDVEGGTLTGPVRTSGSGPGAGTIRICGTTIIGPVTVQYRTGPVIIGTTNNSCAGTRAFGPVTIAGNTGGGSVYNLTVIGPLTITNNAGGFTTGNDTAHGPVRIRGNS